MKQLNGFMHKVNIITLEDDRILLSRLSNQKIDEDI